jgi:peroxiredoxin
MRSWRYSAFIDNGNVVKMFVEDGKNDESNDDDPFKVSDVNTMLNFLKG